MAKDDKEFEYIAALQDFSKSLKYFVESIKNQVEKGNDVKGAIEASAEQAKGMAEMAEELKVVSATTLATKSNTEQILDIVKGIKQQKKSSLVDKLVGTKDKAKSVAEGIKSIALMAGSILAIGLAFKVVGDVDFASVLALAVALPLIAEAFNKVGEMEGDPVDTAFAMILMSGAVAVSGYLLSLMPELSFMQMGTAIAVSIAMGISMYALGETADALDGKIGGIYKLLPAMPLIAAAIYASALLLQNLPEIDLMKTLKTTLGVTGALVIFGAGIWVFEKLGIGASTAIKGSIAMTVIAGAILATSYILGAGDYTNAPPLEWSLNAGVALLGGGLIAMGLGLGISLIIPGVLGMLAVAGGIMATSHILGAGAYSNYPTLDWATGVGLAMGAFGLSAVALGAVMLTGIGALALIAGIAAMVGVAEGLVLVAGIIGTGNYTGGPSEEWAKGVGMALAAFTSAVSELSPSGWDLIGGNTMQDKIKALITVGSALPIIATAIAGGNYTGGPTADWGMGVGAALTSFTNAISELSPSGWDLIGGTTMQDKINALITVGSALPIIASAIGKGNYTGGPSADWGNGVGASVAGFANAIASMADVDLDNLSSLILAVTPIAGLMKYFATQLSGVNFGSYPTEEWITGITTFMEDFMDLDVVDDAADAAKQIMMLSTSYFMLSKSITALGKSLSTVTTAPDLTGIYGGLVTLSLIDSDNLEDTLELLNDKKDQFKNVLSMIQAQSSVTIDEGTFAFNKDNSEAKSAKTAPTTGIKTINSTPQVKAQPVTAAPVKVDKQEKLLNQLVSLMGQMNSVLGEIADNTSHKITSSNIIGN